ncbi:hypothetical protein CsSME_00006235 [Camellia sinensis var. sinensis]
MILSILILHLMLIMHIFPMEILVSVPENAVFTSPEIAKSFDFSSEERIYNWYFILQRNCSTSMSVSLDNRLVWFFRKSVLCLLHFMVYCLEMHSLFAIYLWACVGEEDHLVLYWCL